MTGKRMRKICTKRDTDTFDWDEAVIYYGEEIGQHGLNNYPIQSNRYDFDWNQVDTQSADANSMLD